MFLLQLIKFKLFFFKITSLVPLNFYAKNMDNVIPSNKRYFLYNLCLKVIFRNLLIQGWPIAILKNLQINYYLPYNAFRHFSWQSHDWRTPQYILQLSRLQQGYFLIPAITKKTKKINWSGDDSTKKLDLIKYNLKGVKSPNSLIDYKLLQEGVTGLAYHNIRNITHLKRSNFDIVNPVFRNQLQLDQRYDRSFVSLPRKIFMNKRKSQWLSITNQGVMKKVLIYFNYIYNDRGGIYPNKLIFSEPSIMYNLRHIFPYFHSNTLRKFMLTKIHYKKWSSVVNNFNFPAGESGFFNIKKLKQSNIIPIKSLPYTYKKILFDKYTQFKFAGLFWLMSYRFVSLLQGYFSSEVYLSFNKSTHKYVTRSKATKVLRNIRRYRNPSDKPYFIDEYSRVLFTFFASKDPYFLIRWIQKNVLRVPIKKQWAILRFLRSTLNRTFPLFRGWFAVRGYRVIIKGKIGKTGSVRKKKIIIAGGDYTFSDVFLKADEAGGIVRTETGAIGIRVMVTF